MADNKNMELNDEMMAKASGGTEEGSQPQFSVGDTVANGFGRIGTVTEVYPFSPHIWMYAVHWNATDEFPEEDERDISENRLHSA